MAKVEWAGMDPLVIGEYTTKAVDYLEKSGEEISIPAIQEWRDRIYLRDMELASIVNGMKFGSKKGNR